MRTFLCYDGASINDQKYKLYEVSIAEGLKRLVLQPHKYYLLGTMGRNLIVRRGIWSNLSLYPDNKSKEK